MVSMAKLMVLTDTDDVLYAYQLLQSIIMLMYYIYYLSTRNA